jgi:uncharacterized protein (UPF0333 family)
MFKSTERSRKAQLSMEFLVLFIIFLIAVSIALVSSINRSKAIMQAQIDLETERAISNLADKINTAYIEGDGFYMNLTLPARIYRINYTIVVNANQVILNLDNTSYVKQLLTDNITGQPAKGINTVYNIGGEIFIEEAQ